MKLSTAIEKLQAIHKQKPEADFDFVFLGGNYGLEVKEILYDDEKHRGIVIVTDQSI